MKYRHFLSKCCTRTIFWTKISTIVKILTVCIIPVTFGSLTMKEKELIFHFFIPGINGFKSPGFEITSVLQCLMLLVLASLFLLCEVQILGICVNLCTMGDILISTIRELDVKSENLDQQLNDIIKLYYEYVDFIEAFKSAFSVSITLKFLTSILNISMILFIIQVVSCHILFLKFYTHFVKF